MSDKELLTKLEKEIINIKPNTQEFIDKNKQISHLQSKINCLNNIKRTELEILNTKECLKDLELQEIAQTELLSLEKQLEYYKILLYKILDGDKYNKNVILEIRAGTGGVEAALFAADLHNMYMKYAILKNWKYEIVNISHTELNGIKEVRAFVNGENVYARLRHESGVHRVQRVPQTESSGRIHTSAATVAVLQEVQHNEIKIDANDLRIDTFRSSGPGGQSVNTTDSAVRITHLSTGIVVQQQDEKSQYKNKEKAMKILRATLHEHQLKTAHKKESAARKAQVGSGDRSEKIRTYNFKERRVTDHRINLTSYNMEAVLNGEELDKFIDNLYNREN